MLLFIFEGIYLFADLNNDGIKNTIDYLPVLLAD